MIGLHTRWYWKEELSSGNTVLAGILFDSGLFRHLGTPEMNKPGANIKRLNEVLPQNIANNQNEAPTEELVLYLLHVVL